MIQTRGYDGDIRQHATLADAFSHSMREDIWKISFTLDTGERVRLVYDNGWIFEDITGNRFKKEPLKLVK